ncbi:MAG: hypothetical protein LQ348_001638 [Seirophora lacunosa]|nr:MAG: hypothetical protein LQ348_001638 [Seirophora lacunosa]
MYHRSFADRGLPGNHAECYSTTRDKPDQKAPNMLSWTIPQQKTVKAKGHTMFGKTSDRQTHSDVPNFAASSGIHTPAQLPTPPYPICPPSPSTISPERPNHSFPPAVAKYHHHTISSAPSAVPRIQNPLYSPPSPTSSVRTAIYSPPTENAEPCTRLQPALCTLISLELKIHDYTSHTFDHILSFSKQCIQTCASLARQEQLGGLRKYSDATLAPLQVHEHVPDKGGGDVENNRDASQQDEACTCCLTYSSAESFCTLLAVLIQRIADLLEKLSAAIGIVPGSNAPMQAQKLPVEIGSLHLESVEEVEFVVRKLLVLQLRNLETLVSASRKRAEIHEWRESIKLLEAVAERCLGLRKFFASDDCGSS